MAGKRRRKELDYLCLAHLLDHVLWSVSRTVPIIRRIVRSQGFFSKHIKLFFETRSRPEQPQLLTITHYQFRQNYYSPLSHDNSFKSIEKSTWKWKKKDPKRSFFPVIWFFVWWNQSSSTCFYAHTLSFHWMID